ADKNIFPWTERHHITQRLVHSGAGIVGTAVSDEDIQVRPYPTSFGGQFESGGYEVVERLDLPGHAQKTAEDAVALLTAKSCPAGRTAIALARSPAPPPLPEPGDHPSRPAPRA